MTIKRCWACFKELGVAHYCATDIKGVYCDAACLEAGRGKVRLSAMPKQEDTGGQGWISTDERLPKNKDLVLLSLAEPYYDCRIHLGYRWLTGNGGHAMYQIQNLSAVGEDEVTHWQPLPAPPVAQKGETGQCGACEHWVNPIHGGEFGVCRVLTYGGSPYLYNNGVNTIRTNKGFGCIEFQAKDA